MKNFILNIINFVDVAMRNCARLVLKWNCARLVLKLWFGFCRIRLKVGLIKLQDPLPLSNPKTRCPPPSASLLRTQASNPLRLLAGASSPTSPPGLRHRPTSTPYLTPYPSSRALILSSTPAPSLPLRLGLRVGRRYDSSVARNGARPERCCRCRFW
jgi:hypothetical protein